jgi:hypothetical protein
VKLAVLMVVVVVVMVVVLIGSVMVVGLAPLLVG